MRKLVSMVLSLIIAMSLFPISTPTASAMSIDVGDYVEMGTYYGKPILWRCVDIDENGPLMLSDKIISIKPFDAKGTNTSGSHGRGYYTSGTQGYYRQIYGSNYWADSNMRSWLNSTEPAGKVTWLCGNPPDASHVWSGYNEYDDEAGFLTNFTQSERNAMKTVTQKSLLDGYEYSKGSSNTRDPNYHIYDYDIYDVVQNYDTALSEQVTDKMFLLDVKQVNEVYKNGDTLGASYYIGEPTAECVANSEYKDSYLATGKKWYYWLRSPSAYYDFSYCARFVYSDGYVNYYNDAYYSYFGVRPAFYLADNASLLIGDGSEGNPYRIKGTINEVTCRGTTTPRGYGAVVKDKTEAGDIYDLANEFRDACLEYISTVRSEASTYASNSENIEEIAEELKKNNNGNITFNSSSIPDSAKDAAYFGYASYLQELVDKGISIGKIDLDDHIIIIDAKLFNSISSHIQKDTFCYTHNGYNIDLNATGFGGASFGTMKLKKGKEKYTVTICTKPEDTAKAMSEFISSLKEITDDVLRQALQTVISELDDFTGFSEYRKTLIEDRLKKYTKKIREAGFGNVLKIIKKCYDGNSIVYDIIAFDDAEHISDALSDAKKIHKKISSLKYTDEDIDNFVVKQALEKAESARKKLEDELYRYIYPDAPESPDEPGFFEKVGSFFSSLFQCPVEFTVYNEAGDEIGYVRNGEVYYTEDIYIETFGDVKKLYIPQGMKVNIEMTGTDEGEFNYVLEEVIDGAPVGRLNYYGMPLSKGCEYTQELATPTLSGDVAELPLKSESSTVNADEFLPASSNDCFVVVTTECDGNGVAIGAGEYARGDSVKLTAISSSDFCRFAGWYVDGELVSADAIYQFTAKENVTVKAMFKEQFIIDADYSVTVSEEFEDDFYIMICENETYSNNILVTPFGDAPAKTLNLYCNAYSRHDETIIDNKLLSAPLDENSRYKITDVDFSNCYKIQLTDEAGTVMADIIRNIDDTDVYISNDINSTIFISDNYVSADIELYNRSDESKDVWCGMAAYSQDNSLISISGVPVNVGSATSAEVALAMDNDTKPYYIKIYVWDSLETMSPITNAVILNTSDEILQ